MCGIKVGFCRALSQRNKVNGMKKGLFPYVSTMDKPFLYHLPLYILRPLFFRSTMTFSIFPSFISVF